MPRKNSILKFQIMTSGNMASASITSTVTQIQFLDNIGIQINYTGSSPVGVVNVQISADYAQDPQGVVTNTGNWINMTFGTTTDIAIPGATSPIYFDIQETSAPWIRVVYTKTSGTGTMNAFITAKEV